MGTLIASGLEARLPALDRWFSTNMLDNRDRIELEHPKSLKMKEHRKLNEMEVIIPQDQHSDHQKGFSHLVRITYGASRADNNEGWGDIDLTGWLGRPAQLTGRLHGPSFHPARTAAPGTGIVP